MKRYSTKWVWIGMLALFGILTFGLARNFHLFGSANVNLGTVTRANLIQRVTVSGNILPFRRTSITPPYNAYVKKIYVRVGDKVKPGDPIVSLVQNLRDLGEHSFPLRAPFGGTVVQIPRSEGEYVETAKDLNTLVRVDDLSRLLIIAEIPEGEIPKIQMGQEVLIKANGVPNKQYHGKIFEIALAAKEKEKWGRTGDKVDFDVRLEITDADAQIVPGMSAIVDIITNHRDKVLVLKHEFVDKEGDGYFVTTHNKERRNITVGLQNEEAFEVLSGVKEGDKIQMVDFLKGS